MPWTIFGTDRVLQFLSRHEILAPLAVRQIRVALEPKHAISVRERHRVERAPKVRREHVDGLGTGGYHYADHTLRVCFSRSNSGAATRTRNAGRRPSRLNLLMGSLDSLSHPFRVTDCLADASHFLTQPPLQISILVALQTFGLANRRLDCSLLGSQQLGVLQSMLDLLPLLIQIAFHFVVWHCSAIPTSPNLPLLLIDRRNPVGHVIAAVLLRTWTLGSLPVRARPDSWLHGVRRPFLPRARVRTANGDAQRQAVRQAHVRPVGILKLTRGLFIPAHGGVLLVRASQILVSRLELLQGNPELFDSPVLHVIHIVAGENDLNVRQHVRVARRQRQDALTPVGLRESDDVADEPLDALVGWSIHARIVLAVEPPDDATSKRKQELGSARQAAQSRRQSPDPQVVRERKLGHARSGLG